MYRMCFIVLVGLAGQWLLYGEDWRFAAGDRITRMYASWRDPLPAEGEYVGRAWQWDPVSGWQDGEDTGGGMVWVGGDDSWPVDETITDMVLQVWGPDPPGEVYGVPDWPTGGGYWDLSASFDESWNWVGFSEVPEPSAGGLGASFFLLWRIYGGRWRSSGRGCWRT